MWRATIKGLLAHKLRLVLTGLAIVLGVSFVAGTYILTDTINRTFDELFAVVNKGVAVSVQGVPKFEANSFGQDAGQPERVPASLVDEIKAVPGVADGGGDADRLRASWSWTARRSSTGGAPTLGVSTIEDPELSAATVRAGRRPAARG